MASARSILARDLPQAITERTQPGQVRRAVKANPRTKGLARALEAYALGPRVPTRCAFPRRAGAPGLVNDGSRRRRSVHRLTTGGRSPTDRRSVRRLRRRVGMRAARAARRPADPPPGDLGSAHPEVARPTRRPSGPP
jgi:hypothetical protein